MGARLLDHVGVVAPELPALREAWRRLGFAPTEPRPLLGRDAAGRTVPLGQHSCHAVFAGGYVELTAVETGVASHHLDPWRRRGAGAWIVAFGADDADAARARAAAAGLPVTPVMEATRAIDYGARHGDARFRWFMLEPAASPEALLCVVQHLTPELVFQRDVQVHPNGARALLGLTIVAADPVALAARYERLLGVPASGTADAQSLATAAERLELLTPDAFEERYPGVPSIGDARPAALRIEVVDPERAAAQLRAHGVAAVRTPGGMRVGPADAGGAIVEFVA